MSTTESLRERINHVLAETGVSQAKFALAAGMDLERLKNMCSGKIQKLRPDEARNISSAYGYRDAWLIGGKGPKKLTPIERSAQPSLEDIRAATADVVELGLEGDAAALMQELLFFFRRKDHDGVLDTLGRVGLGWSEFVQVPRYDIRASAGPGALVDGEHVLNHMAFRNDWLRHVLGLNPQRLALIDVDGDSMMPTLTHGDMILIDTTEGKGVTEGIHVINLSGRLLVKRLRPLVDGSIEVISDNQRYATEMVSAMQFDQLKVVGRVVWQGRRV